MTVVQQQLGIHKKSSRFKNIGIVMAISFISFTPAYAAHTTYTQGLGCNILTTPTSYEFFFPTGTNLASFTISRTDTNLQGGFFSSVGFGMCNAITLPTTPYSCPFTGVEPDGATNYRIFMDSVNDTYCAYQYDVDTSADPVRTNARAIVLPPVPVNVPIFTPLGLIGLLSGLLWFGRRRKRLQVKN